MKNPEYLKHPVNGRILPWTQILAGRDDMIPCDADGNEVSVSLEPEIKTACSQVSSSGLGDPEKRESLNDDLDMKLKEAIEERFRRKSLVYDGVMGTPDDWIPERDQERFDYERNLLLNNYSHEQVLEFLDLWPRYIQEKSDVQQYINKELDHKDEIEGSVINKVRQLDDSPFEKMHHELVQAIDYLYLIKKAIHAGDVEGIKMLGGEYAKRGYTEWMSRKLGADLTNERMNAARDFCVEHAAVLWGTEKAQGKKITRTGAMSELLWQKLGANEYWQPTTPGKVREWIIKAGKENRLIIPKEAQKPGAPSK